MAEMNMDTVSLSRVKKLVEQLERQKTQLELSEEDDLEVAFEYIIGSFFPDVWNNIQQALKDEHTKGYIEGLNEQIHK